MHYINGFNIPLGFNLLTLFAIGVYFCEQMYCALCFLVCMCEREFKENLTN